MAARMLFGRVAAHLSAAAAVAGVTAAGTAWAVAVCETNKSQQTDSSTTAPDTAQKPRPPPAWVFHPHANHHGCCCAAMAESSTSNPSVTPGTYTRSPDITDPANVPFWARWDENWDHMEAVTEEQGPANGSRYLYLIRHGQYVMDAAEHEKGLTTLGWEQARCLGDRLAKIVPQFDAVYTSDVVRAMETTDAVVEKLPNNAEAEVDQLLREGAPAAPVPSHPAWKPSDAQFFADSARIEAAFRRHFHRPLPTQNKDSHELLICHANVIRYFVCRALQLPPEAWLRISLPNASITVVKINPSGICSVQCMGDSGHIPDDKRTFN